MSSSKIDEGLMLPDKPPDDVSQLADWIGKNNFQVASRNQPVAVLTMRLLVEIWRELKKLNGEGGGLAPKRGRPPSS